MHYIFILLSCFFFFSSCAQNNGKSLPPDIQYHTYHLQNTAVKISVHNYLPASKFTFIILHDDEQTAEKATLQVLEQYGGKLISIENNKERTLSFILKGKSYEFDPNRMFTPAGIKASLQTYGSDNATAAAEIEKFAAFLLNKISDSALPVAVHNNTNEEFAITDYMMPGALQHDAAAVYQNPDMDVDEFVFTTSGLVYDFYKRLNVNVVLQNNQQVIDDGSLSVYYGKQNKNYINIEAEHEHTEMQIKMIELLYQLLPDF
ncbi:MAG TPA: hypothetical protein VFS22_10310 [Flavisolibacter sp.]|nr:hypothetical protein [Flavisolibacter sp.]